MTDPRFSGIGMTSARTRDRLVQRLREQGITNLSVLDRIRNLPRHIFVDEAIASRAYEDTALPIGFGQTISQPYIVARMTEALLDGPPLKQVLEVGTGCGYQTAVLAPLVERIYTIERIEGLQKRARVRLKELGIRNVRFKVGDGSAGWRTQAPFDGILVAAAPLVVPEELIAQLAVDGRLIVPVGPEGRQQLVSILRREQGVERRVLADVSFVPLVGGVG
ncbi:MAG TPA: protein-L-isoaspartate(D-aspartate) O-methyltransferase [Steroidobacteraceae bacterium]|jgi:protein-L-isoaspartate(D-aspartate) O-methyltransferase|nr:protein-L-isoaspartate(D-aspartate) O-methyltransferase [Steroidobacteraceae bacterium]